MRFRDGYKYYDDGTRTAPVKIEENRSKTDPDKKPYKTILYDNGTGSCDCRGWIFHQMDGCTHTKKMGARPEYQSTKDAATFQRDVNRAQVKPRPNQPVVVPSKQAQVSQAELQRLLREAMAAQKDPQPVKRASISFGDEIV